jgi:5-methylcytosine-specific restriction enzyme A
MNTFLITFKPAAENPDRGWPLEELQKLVSRQDAGEQVVEAWRFNNRRNISLGDRVFLLCQGKLGPAIIGYGNIAGEQRNNAGQLPVRFEALVDPTAEVLADQQDLLRIGGGQKVWRTQSSGVKLADSIGLELEALVVGKSPRPRAEEWASNPDWKRDELILALNVYLQHRPNPPGKGSREILELSIALNRLGAKLFSAEERARTFHNENGVYMKLMNFRRFDPKYTVEGKTGLVRGARAEEEVWKEFAEDPVRCRQVAEAIVASLDDPEVEQVWFEPDTEEGIQEAPEGRLLTRKHLARERNRKLVESKRKQAMRVHGNIICEVCGFDFAIHYGERGKGFIECHHTKPVATLAEGHKTHVDDLALVCANCHRMIHRGRPWLSVAALKELMTKIKSSRAAMAGTPSWSPTILGKNNCPRLD